VDTYSPIERSSDQTTESMFMALLAKTIDLARGNYEQLDVAFVNYKCATVHDMQPSATAR
jgi:hypothetical protein